ncbi:hypothetical protein E2C01_053168 [Portunus trituberculatus]|uniref:Uncharacterized protein n=1 Tax=Portunus trituberculatus TaxID=210409 RepID=A0A5B7GNL1_PORTR|nr:hypothetical protein [Portunus trituberculatus]
MQSGRINDTQISASSSYDVSRTGPPSARSLTNSLYLPPPPPPTGAPAGGILSHEVPPEDRLKH